MAAHGRQHFSRLGHSDGHWLATSPPAGNRALFRLVVLMAASSLIRRSLRATDIIGSVAAIALSYFAGSALAWFRQLRVDRAAAAAVTPLGDLLAHLEAAQIKSTTETVKALYEAVAPIAAGTAAIWAAFNHILL